MRKSIWGIKIGTLLFSLSLAIAQNPGKPPTSPPPNTDNTPPRTVPRQPSLPPTPPSARVPETKPNIVFLSGNVVTEDGSAPPFGAVIELECGGMTTTETLVSPNGHFSYQLGSRAGRSQVFPDASHNLESYNEELTLSRMAGDIMNDSPRQSSRRIVGCQLRAQLHGYNSTKLSIVRDPLPGLNDIGTIVVYPRERVQGTTVSVTGLLAPKEARKLVDKADKAIRKKNLPGAEELLKSAVLIYPKYAEAWFVLGQIHEEQGRMDEAYDDYRHAIRVDEVFVRPYLRLAQLESSKKNWTQAAELSERLLALDAITLLEGYYVNALAHLNLNQLDIAEKRAQKGIQLDFTHRHPQLHLILANVNGLRRNTAGTIKELKNYLRFSSDSPGNKAIRSRLQQLEEQARAEAVRS